MIKYILVEIKRGAKALNGPLMCQWDVSPAKEACLESCSLRGSTANILELDNTIPRPEPTRHVYNSWFTQV